MFYFQSKIREQEVEQVLHGSRVVGRWPKQCIHMWINVKMIKEKDKSSKEPCCYSQLIFNKGAQNTWWKKESLFNTFFLEKCISSCRRLKLDLCLSPCTKINSKWIEDLNIRPETLKQLQEVVGNTLDRHREQRTEQNSKSSTSKRKNEQLWLHKTEKLLHSKKNKMKTYLESRDCTQTGKSLCQLLIW
jgi:hypothetical protein